MPELPEVETVRKQIECTLPLVIEEVSLSAVAGSILDASKRKFNPVGETLVLVERIGKLLILKLKSGNQVLSHFGMSGGWRISKTPVEEKHTHVQLHCRDRSGMPTTLAYVDPRRFGCMLWLQPHEAELYRKKLGPDVLDPEFSGKRVFEVLKRFPNRLIKPLLLDQKLFAGIGNYLASEICAMVGLHPARKAGQISRTEADQIAQAARSIVMVQITNHGLTFGGGYRDAYGGKGGGVSQLKVFKQKVCGICHLTPVKKIILSQRGTYFCPRCQRE